MLKLVILTYIVITFTEIFVKSQNKKTQQYGNCLIVWWGNVFLPDTIFKKLDKMKDLVLVYIFVLHILKIWRPFVHFAGKIILK